MRAPPASGVIARQNSASALPPRMPCSRRVGGRLLGGAERGRNGDPDRRKHAPHPSANTPRPNRRPPAPVHPAPSTSPAHRRAAHDREPSNPSPRTPIAPRHRDAIANTPGSPPKNGGAAPTLYPAFLRAIGSPWAADNPVTAEAGWLNAHGEPNDLVVVDDQKLAVTANRLVPSALTETSTVRYNAGYLSLPLLIRATHDPRARAILLTRKLHDDPSYPKNARGPLA